MKQHLKFHYLVLGFESETSSQACVLNTWSPATSTLWGGSGSFNWWDLDGESQSLGLYVLSPQFLASLLPVCHEVNSLLLHAPTAMLACFSLCPESTKQETGEFGVCKCQSK